MKCIYYGDCSFPYSECQEDNPFFLCSSREIHKPMYECKYCGLNEIPSCNKCVREDGKLLTDELVRD